MNMFNNNSNRINSTAFDDLKMIGYFSLKDERTMNFDASQLRYYVKPESDNVHLDLNGGFETIRRYTNTFLNRNINKILRWIQKFHEQIISPESERKWIRPDFVCRRGTIERILRISNNVKEDMIICAAKWKGTIYLCKFETEATTISKQYAQSHQDPRHWYGKLNHYMKSEIPNVSRPAHTPIDENSEFNGVFLARLGNHTLLYSGGMDAVCSEKPLEDPLPLDKLKFIEFRTRQFPYRRHIFTMFRSHRWWSQCVPVGVEEILCGFRDENGIVQEIETFTINDLIEISEEYWNPVTSMNFINNLLTYIASTVVNDCDETIYKFERIPYRGIKLTEVSPSSEFSFLPQWYTDSTI